MRLKITLLIVLCIALIQIGRAQKVLTGNFGHSDDVNTILFTNDGKYIISGSDDGLIKVWDVKTGKELKSLVGHKNEVKSIALSPDNKFLASEGIDSTIIIWNTTSWEQEKTVYGYTRGIKSVSFSPDGKYLASRTKFWNTNNWQEVEKNKSIMLGPSSFSPDGKYQICADVKLSSGKTILNLASIAFAGESVTSFDASLIRMWEVETGKEIKKYKGWKKYLFKDVKYSPDGKHIAGVREDFRIKIWDTQTEKVFDNINCIAECCTFNPDGKTLVTGNIDGTIIWWDLESGKNIKTLTAHKDTITAITFSPNGKYIISASRDKDIKLWDAETKELIQNFESHKTIVNSIALSDNNNLILSGNDDNHIRLWDLSGNKNISVFKSKGLVSDVDLSGNNKYIASAGEKKVELWDIKTKQLIESYKGKGLVPSNNTVEFYNDDKNIISYSEKINIWDIEKKKIIEAFSTHLSPRCMAISSDGDYIAGGADMSKIKIYTSNGKKYKKLGNTDLYIYSLDFSPDGKYLASGSGNGYIKIWDIKNEKELKTFNNDEPDIQKSNNYIDYKCINNLSFSPNGKLLISASSKLKLWNVESGELLKELNGHTSTITSVVFSSDGKYILSGSKDGKMKIWDTSSGDLIITMIGVSNSEDFVVYTPDGKFDGTQRGMELFHYVEGMNIIPLSSMYEQYYTPNLLSRILSGEKLEEPEIKVDDLALPPIVEIISPTKQGDLRGVTPFGANQLKSTVKEIQVKVKATDNGGGIDEIRLYVNGKLLEATTRGLKPIVSENSDETKTFTVQLIQGVNSIKATAFNNQRTESIADELDILYEGVKKTANLYVFVIGLDKYKNPKYNLNYALADATAFQQKVEDGSNSIFGSVNSVLIKDNEATKEKILNEFKQLQSKVVQEDVFIFYYAGHGVMSDEDKAQFYIVPHDVTQLYGNNEMLKSKAISASELQDISKTIKAQKQMFVLDACQSGGMVDMLASRGAAEEKAIAQLARSTGTFWLAASTSEQFATEFKDLGHGVFTYAILEGLKGQADGGTKDKKITVKEISAFVYDKVSELSEKYKGSAQYPTSYGAGQDFPILILK